MLELKKETRERLVSMNVQVPQVDKEIVLALGDGQLSAGIRMILFTFRDQLKEIVDLKKSSKHKKKAS